MCRVNLVRRTKYTIWGMRAIYETPLHLTIKLKLMYIMLQYTKIQKDEYE